ncbi:MAG: UvrD-helicase domain-containing protein [Planctomycetota bacterium]
MNKFERRSFAINGPDMEGSAHDLLHGLTEAQCAAVRHIDGPMLTLAGPGSGKTRVVTHRIAHLIAQGIPPHQILALTFTNKAADEMRRRLETLVPPEMGGKKVWMGTFHRFCAHQLRRLAPMVGLGENYSIYDMSDAKATLKRAIQAAEVSTTHASPEQIASSISRCKSRLVTPDMMQGHAMTPQETLALRVYPHYQQHLLRNNAVDFDDLLLHVAVVLRENPEVRDRMDARFRYILVDEYQDTNLAQYAIVRAMSIDHPNLAVTGDPDQSIYGWRGADLNNILDFEKDYPNVHIVRLEKNYRSTPNILRAADELIRHNKHRKPKALYTDNEEGDAVMLRMFQDGREEANEIVDEITAAVAAGTITPDKIAIFVRMNALTRAFEQAMRNRSLPYQIINGVEFYQRKEIKDLIAYLHLVNNPQHDVALSRIINTPTRGIGAMTTAKLREDADQKGISMLEAARHASENPNLSKRAATMVSKFVAIYDRLCQRADQPLEDTLRFLIEEIGYSDYLNRTAAQAEDANPMANVDELIAGAMDFDRQHPEDGSLELFLEQVALVADTDALDPQASRVTLMTLHASKGLEFPWVYVVGVEDDLLPHARSKETEWEIEEERRLLFVGMTRAEQRLQLTCCKRRLIRGDLRPVIPSPFLSELPISEMRHIEPAAGTQYFDDGLDDPIDQSVPDEWDQPAWDGDGNDTSGVAEAASVFLNSATQVTPSSRKQNASPRKRPSLSGLKTAADLMNHGKTPLIEFREGVRVRHDEYGHGEILSVSGRGMKRTARVRFDAIEKSFRLAHTHLEVVPSDEAGGTI